MMLRDLVIGTFLVCGILLGLTTFYTDLYTTYGVTGGSNNTALLANSTMADMQNSLGSLDANIKSTSTDSTTGTEYNVLSGAFNGMLTIMDMPNILGDLISGLSSEFIEVGMPTWVFAVISGVLVAFVIFEVISGLLKVKV